MAKLKRKLRVGGEIDLSLLREIPISTAAGTRW
jgi:hypothetical protein